MKSKHLATVTLVTAIALPLLSGAEETVALPTIELPSPIHFTAPDGNDIVIAPGTYRIEETATPNLRLTADSPQAMHEISAAWFTHEEMLTTPLAFAVREAEQEDAVHLLLLFPNGKGLDAAGRTGHIQTRGIFDHVRTQSRYTAVAMQQGRVPLDADMQPGTSWQTQATIQREIEEQKKRLEALQEELRKAQDDAQGNWRVLGTFFGDDPGAANTGTPLRFKRCDNCTAIQQR